MRTKICVALAILVIGALPVAGAERAARPYLDIPITSRINRSGDIRFGVWVKVGERSVEALLDTGSTGLRVLPSVFPQDFQGVPTDVAFGAGVHMAGLATQMPIEIGSMTGTATVEVVQAISCVPGRTECGVPIPGVDSYLIGGDGNTSDGYSAILGIGMPYCCTTLENPLVALGVKQWIVDLPRPYDIADGHLILDPEARATQGFTMLDRHGIADADGCIAGGSLAEAACGTVLFDTGGPAMDVTLGDINTASVWDPGTAGTLSFKVPNADPLKLDFKAGENEGLTAVTVTPKPKRDLSEPFILAGVDPFFTYDVLYDPATHTVGLRKRDPKHAPREAAADVAMPRKKSR